MPRQIKKQHTGGMVNASLPPHVESYILEKFTGGTEILSKVRELVARYRDWSSFRNTEPTKNETLKHTKKTQTLIRGLLDHLDLTPESIKAMVSYDLHRTQGQQYEGAHQALKRDLELLRLLTARAEAKAQEWPDSSGGERRKNLERILLSDVALLFEPVTSTKTLAANIAAVVLRDCGIHGMPDARLDSPSKKPRDVVTATRKKLDP